MASFTERYHEFTKYRPETIDKLGSVRWDQQPEPFKDIPPGRKIDLVPHLKALFDSFENPSSQQTIEAGLKQEALPALSRLLYFTLGITARVSGMGGSDLFLRAAPSAGGLYPTELYVAAREFSDLPAGLYHYHAQKSALIPVWEGDFFADLKHHFADHPAIEKCRCLILFTGMYGRSAWRYKERAYRRILLDTGHAAANLLEVANALRLDATAIGGFYDSGLEELFFLMPKEEFPLLGIALGSQGTLPKNIGQLPSALPNEAAKRADIHDPMQIQQNTCERIYADLPLRPSVVTTASSLPCDFEKFNPQTVIPNRRSTRKFNSGSMLLKEAEDMLRFAFRSKGPDWRLAPGCLAFHIVVLAVDGREPGLYDLNPETLEWTLKKRDDFREELHGIGLGQELTAECSFALFHTADMAELVSAYGDRGYRYACMDAGQIGERIQLWAVHRGLGSSGIGGYYDDWANEMLDLPLTHGILYLTTVGVPDE
ncbi:MAG TPA: hypothetical protein DCQ83_06965 [Fibrobacteres bacterium]|nr:hypothetical protein [Fibrobacterota bacterium]